MKLTREHIFAVVTGLAALACDKTETPQPESAAPTPSPARPAPSGAPNQAAVAAREVPAAAASASPDAGGKQAGEKEKKCGPGAGCAPGACG